MTRSTVQIRREVRRAIVDHARRDSPRECCGFLLGTGRHVRFAAPMANIARGNSRFRIADREHLALRRLLRGIRPALDIVGVYHSHPAGGAWPSASDVAEAHYPDWVHLIVGLTPRLAVRAFRIGRRGSAPEPIRLVSSRGAQD